MVDRNKVTWPEFLTWEGWEKISVNTITEASEYAGEKSLNIDVPYSSEGKKRKRVIGEWCDLIPTLKGIESVCLRGTTTQALFDSVCSLESIVDFRVANASRGLKNIDALSSIKGLKRAFLDHFGAVTSLRPFSELKELEWVELIDFHRIQSLDGLGGLNNLKGLIFVSRGRSKLIHLDSYQTIASLKKLRYLDLCGTRVDDSNLDCLTGLSNLEYMDIPLMFPVSEIAKVVYHLPNCDHGLGPYRDITGWGAKCTKCGGDHIVVPVTKGRRYPCKACDSDKVHQLEVEFNDYLARVLVD